MAIMRIFRISYWQSLQEDLCKVSKEKIKLLRYNPKILIHKSCLEYEGIWDVTSNYSEKILGKAV